MYIWNYDFEPRTNKRGSGIMEKNYKIFTEAEFKQRVQLFWSLIIKSEFPNTDLKKIEIKKDSNVLASAYRSSLKLVFSKSFLDGTYRLGFVDDIIKHEICHIYDDLKHGGYRYKNGRRLIHDKVFKNICKKFECSGYAAVKASSYASNKEMK